MKKKSKKIFSGEKNPSALPADNQISSKSAPVCYAVIKHYCLPTMAWGIIADNQIGSLMLCYTFIQQMWNLLFAYGRQGQGTSESNKSSPLSQTLIKQKATS